MAKKKAKKKARKKAAPKRKKAAPKRKKAAAKKVAKKRCAATVKDKKAEYIPPSEIPHLVEVLRREMKRAAEDLEFEKAAQLRDRIRELKKN